MAKRSFIVVWWAARCWQWSRFEVEGNPGVSFAAQRRMSGQLHRRIARKTCSTELLRTLAVEASVEADGAAVAREAVAVLPIGEVARG